MLRVHAMIPSMSRPAHPHDNASCESFMKTLKREEIYANEYRDLEHLAESLEAFTESYYNRCRLHSELGYRLPEEFERQSENGNKQVTLAAATMTHFQMGSCSRRLRDTVPIILSQPGVHPSRFQFKVPSCCAKTLSDCDVGVYFEREAANHPIPPP
jgi:hypothetical protein